MRHCPRELIVLTAAILSTLSIIRWAPAQNSASSVGPSAVSILRPEWYEDQSPPCWYEHAYDIDRFGWTHVCRIHGREPRYIGFAHDPTAAVVDRRFVYRVTIRNNGAKVIKSIDWYCVFIDPQAHREVSRRQFHSEQEIRPGKLKTLFEYLPSPPTKVIDVNALANSKPFDEKVYIRRIAYVDGSWLGK